MNILSNYPYKVSIKAEGVQIEILDIYDIEQEIRVFKWENIDFALSDKPLFELIHNYFAQKP